MVASLETVIDTKWYLDFGATNHLISYFSNLTTNTQYLGQDQIYMGDGTGLNILHVGQSSFTSTLSNKVLTLHQLLHAPLITKNLLSISKFAKDNHVFFEFHPELCFVKDQVSHAILMVGKLKYGL